MALAEGCCRRASNEGGAHARRVWFQSGTTQDSGVHFVRGFRDLDFFAPGQDESGHAGSRKIYLIGADPNEPDLMTLKAVRALAQADGALIVIGEVVGLADRAAQSNAQLRAA